jgi:putative spermidine/putrescine transport system ATP-binding protein
MILVTASHGVPEGRDRYPRTSEVVVAVPLGCGFRRPPAPHPADRRGGDDITAADTTAIGLSGLRKSYGDVAAVDGVDLAIAPGEFFTMLGPSGSGKTTLLRIIAGFERPDQGRVELRGVDVTDRPPYDRDVNTVFQDYALFPHMSVQDNVEYGLRIKGTERAARRRSAGDALEMVGLAGLGKRKPQQLSGGQRQRVALARAIVNSPQVLLLDEPLGALDLKLRQGMQVELKRIQREVGITFVYVTHDQEEALTMSDRVAVFNAGRVEQVGTPIDVYDRPTTEFVAGFVGASNLVERDGRRYTVRPERVQLIEPSGARIDGAIAEAGTITDVTFVGMVTRYTVSLDSGTTISAVSPNTAAATPASLEQHGRRVLACWLPSQMYEIHPSVTATAGASEGDTT